MKQFCSCPGMQQNTYSSKSRKQPMTSKFLNKSGKPDTQVFSARLHGLLSKSLNFVTGTAVGKSSMEKSFASDIVSTQLAFDNSESRLLSWDLFVPLAIVKYISESFGLVLSSIQNTTGQRQQLSKISMSIETAQIHKKSNSLNCSPSKGKHASIHHIITADQQFSIKKQIERMFLSEVYSMFPISELLANNCFKIDQRFHEIVTELQKWNKKVQKGQVRPLAKTEFLRNQFLYTSLKNIVLTSTQGASNYERNIDRLYEWYKKNSEGENPMYFSSRKRKEHSELDEEWKVRETFKSNMPLQLKYYDRRQLFQAEEGLQKIHPQDQSKPITEQKLLDYQGIRQYHSNQIKQRQANEDLEISQSKTLLKSKKCRFGEENCRNMQFFKGNFSSDKPSLTKKVIRSTTGQPVSAPKLINRELNCHSVVQAQERQLKGIKKYRLSVAALKTKGFKSRNEPQRPLNRTLKQLPSKSHIAVEKNSLISQRLLSSKKLNQEMQLEQITEFDDFKENKTMSSMQGFKELRNWEGERLLKNPFQKKLKKKKKK